MPGFRVLKESRMTRHRCAASQTIAVGDLVCFNSAGNVVIADATSTKILGVAASAVSASVLNDPILVYDDPNAEFLCKCDNSAQATQTKVGETHDIVVSSGTFLADLDATATNVLFVKRGVSADFDPLLTGRTIEGSTGAGNWTPAWDSTAYIVVQIAAHELKA